MNRTLTVSCLVGILAAATAVAQASPTSWAFKFQGTGKPDLGPAGVWLSGSQTFAVSSTIPGVVDDTSIRDPKDVGSPAAAQSPVIYTSWYRPAWDQGAGSPPWAIVNDYRTPLGPGQYTKTWADLVLWTTPGFDTNETPNIYLHVTPFTNPPTTLDGHDIAYRLIMTQAPITYSGPTSFLLNPAGETVITLDSRGTTAANPISGTGPLAATQNAGYRFNFVTPEPGSLLALGAGLVSLLGVARRRR